MRWHNCHGITVLVSNLTAPQLHNVGVLIHIKNEQPDTMNKIDNMTCSDDENACGT
jgi:hypothetical protein